MVLICTSKQQRQESAITLIYIILLNGNMLNERFPQVNTYENFRPSVRCVTCFSRNGNCSRLAQTHTTREEAVKLT
jgi:hypothetical protein